MAGAAPAPTQTSHVSASARAMPIPPGLLPVAVLLAAAAGILALVPSLSQAVWEVPHLLLLGLVISYGVFSQRNADAGKAREGDGNASAKEGALAWNARYHPDDPLVMVADHAAPCDGDEARGGARERPLSLPVRRLKPAPREPETGGDASDGVGEETDSSASSSGSWAGARAVPSPPSVLEAYMGLSPRDQPLGGDGEVTDWDEDDADGSDDMTVSSERSVRCHFTACSSNDHNDGDGDGDGDDTSVDEELQKLATKAAPEGEEEVDRKADEFIAKFREQIRLQRH